MKHILATLFLFSAFALAAPPFDKFVFEIDGTLMLDGDKVIYEFGKTHIEYNLLKVPSLHAVNFEKKTTVKSGKEIDVSEITFEMSDSQKIVLANCKPVKILRKAFKDPKETPIFLLPRDN